MTGREKAEREGFMEAAWADFMRWAIGNSELVAQFEAETGNRRMPVPKNVIDAAIDKATGVNEQWAIEFTKWVTVNYWGVEEAPAKMRAELAPLPSPVPGARE